LARRGTRGFAGSAVPKGGQGGRPGWIGSSLSDTVGIVLPMILLGAVLQGFMIGMEERPREKYRPFRAGAQAEASEKQLTGEEAMGGSREGRAMMSWSREAGRLGGAAAESND